MKLELPLAIMLLAMGVLVWKWIANDQTASISSQSAQSEADRTLTWEGWISQDRSEVKVDIDVKELFQRVIRDMRYATPLRADVELQVDLFESPFVINGVYTQAGQGTPSARMDLRSGKGAEAIEISQSFDGRFYYFSESSPDQKTYHYVDLFEVTRMGKPRVDCVAGIKGWFGTGGLVPLLEQLASSFDFHIVQSSLGFSLDGGSEGHVTLRGQWRLDTLRQLLRDQVDAAVLQAPVPWHRLPSQLPREIELTLVRHSNSMLFPKSVIYFSSSASGSVVHPVYGVRFSAPVALHDISENWFRIPSAGFDPVDLTSDYLSRIKMAIYYPADGK